MKVLRCPRARYPRFLPSASDFPARGFCIPVAFVSGLPFNPIDFNAMLDLASLPEPWWSADKGYYEGKHWVESSVNGGEDSVAPYDRPPVVYLSAEEQSSKAQLGYSGTCETRVKELALQFITGEKDINDDSVWESYIKDVKSQTDDDFDGILEMLNEKTVK